MSFIFSSLLVLLAVAFYTLLERKCLGYIMLRKGPNKPSLSGILVPLADALKLLAKNFALPFSSSHPVVLFSTCLLFCVSNTLIWCYYSSCQTAYLSSQAALLLSLLSLPVFGIIGIGWGSNSKYSILGGTRAIAQTISYEVSFAVLLLCLASVSGLEVWLRTVDLSTLPHLLIWFLLLLSGLAETNRSPFDMVEGESELVSGFSVEARSSLFTLIFLAEYLSILFQSALLAVLLLRGHSLLCLLCTGFLAFFFVWVRGTLPRFRYDQLMALCWKSVLPFSLAYLFLLLAIYSVVLTLKVISFTLRMIVLGMLHLLWVLFLFGLLFSIPFILTTSNVSSELLSPYECGFAGFGPSHVPFCMKFFLICLIFVLFDLEVLYLFPSLCRRMVMNCFVILLFLGTVFEFAYGSLSWVL